MLKEPHAARLSHLPHRRTPIRSTMSNVNRDGDSCCYCVPCIVAGEELLAKHEGTIGARIRDASRGVSRVILHLRGQVKAQVAVPAVAKLVGDAHWSITLEAQVYRVAERAGKKVDVA